MFCTLLDKSTNSGNIFLLVRHVWSLIYEPLNQVHTVLQFGDFGNFVNYVALRHATRFLDDKCQSNGFFLGNIMASTYRGNCTFELCLSFHSSKYQKRFAKKGKYI